jgi:hypothetical protein
MPVDKVYLGDSVYITVTEDGLVLTTENSADGPSNTIFLEDAVALALVRFIKEHV